MIFPLRFSGFTGSLSFLAHGLGLGPQPTMTRTHPSFPSQMDGIMLQVTHAEARGGLSALGCIL